MRNPYPLHRQKAFIVPGIVPESMREALEEVVTWDEWDPDRDRFSMDWRDYSRALLEKIPLLMRDLMKLLNYIKVNLRSQDQQNGWIIFRLPLGRLSEVSLCREKVM